jgi:hypothetical protein
MSSVSTELATLRAQGANLDDRLQAVDTQQREATAARDAASAALVRLEQKAVTGDTVSAAERKKAEDTLSRAQIEAAAPWAERRAAVQAAIRDHERQLRAFASEHLSELYDDLAGAAQAAAEDVDHACRTIVEAVDRRMAVERDVFALIGLAGRLPDPNAVARTRTDALRQAVHALLQAGGEQAPLLRDDPRQVASVEPTVEAEPDREPEPAATA